VRNKGEAEKGEQSLFPKTSPLLGPWGDVE
jgi:hypothetical protein